MNLTPLIDAPLVIQLHVASAFPAIFVGPFALFGRTSWRAHKVFGYVWMVAMISLCLTGLVIPSHDLAVVGHLGPIHLFCFWRLWGVYSGIRFARLGRIAEHRLTLKWTWFGAMGAAGLANFLPGRTVNQMFLGDAPDAGWIVIGAGILLLIYLWQRDRGQALHLA